MSQQPTQPESTWSKERIEELLRTETFRYQAISLPHGIVTDGHDRSSTADLIFPRDMGDQSVMDVGCGLGFFCFDAKKRGANRVLGVDLETENVRKGRILANVLGQDVEFTFRDLENDPIAEKFDHVLCLNVLHHLVDPINSLDRLIASTKCRLILEVATLGSHDRRMLKINRLEQMLLERLPVMVIGTGGVTAGIKQFYFTRTAVENLLRYRRGCFASVEIIPSEFKGRFIVIGHMHRIRHELVLGAPLPAINKELRTKIQSGSLAELTTHMQWQDGTSWSDSFAAESYHEDQKSEHERLIFEYDFLRPFATGAMTFAHDPATEVISVADEVTTVTTWIHPESLVKRLETAVTNTEGREKKRLTRTLEECQDPHRVIAHYRAWIEYTKRFRGKHVILDSTHPNVVLMSPAEWDAKIAQPFLKNLS